MERMLGNGLDSKQHRELSDAKQNVNPSVSYQDVFDFHFGKVQQLFYDVLGAHDENAALCKEYEKLSSKYKALEARKDQLAERLVNFEHQLVREREAAKKSASEEVDTGLVKLLLELGAEFDTSASTVEKVGYVKEVFTVYRTEINNRNKDIEKLDDQLQEANSRAAKDEQQGSLIHNLLAGSKQKDAEIARLQKQVDEMERELQDARCLTEEMVVCKEDLERYRSAYSRVVAEKDLLVKKHDEEQQKWSLDAIKMQEEIESMKQKNTGSSKGPALFKSKKEMRIEELQHELELRNRDCEGWKTQFGRYRSEKEKDLLSKDEEIDLLKQMINSLQTYENDEKSSMDAVEIKNMFDTLAKKEAQLIELKSQKEALEQGYEVELAHWSAIAGAHQSELEELEQRHAATLKDLDDQVNTKEALNLQLNDELQYYKRLHEMAGQPTSAEEHPLADRMHEGQSAGHSWQSRRGQSTIE